jgi:hypothetical protein
LQGSTRWFDLRIYHDTDGLFHMQHGLRRQPFSEILQQVQTYIDAHPQTYELIFLNLSHANLDATGAIQAGGEASDAGFRL